MKSVFRHILPDHHWSYLMWGRGRSGPLPAVAMYAQMVCAGGLGLVPAPGVGRWLWVRPGTADQEVFQEVFAAKQYALDYGNPSIIIDAGAHAGYATAYFAARYPQALVIALEPEPANFRMLQRNTDTYDNVRRVNAALWRSSTQLSIVDSSVDTWAFQVSEDPDGADVEAFSIPDLMAAYGLSHIDVLKVDIEGAEVEVLETADRWIGSVTVLVIELHDRFRRGCTQALQHALEHYDCDVRTVGMTTMVRILSQNTFC